MRGIYFNEYVAGMFIAGWYHWFIGDELGAETCWQTAADVVKYGTVVMVS